MRERKSLYLSNIRMQLKLLLKSPLIWGILIFLTIYLLSGYYAFFVIDNSYGQLLQASAYIVMGSILIGQLIGMYEARLERKVHFEEALRTYANYKDVYLGKVGAWFLVVLIFIIVSSGFMIGAYLSVGSQRIHYITESIIYIMLYWGLPFFSAGLLGYAIERIVHHPIKYVIVFIISSATSPYNAYLPKSLAYLFNQGEEVPDLSIDAFMGYHIHGDIIIRHLFFFMIAILILEITFIVQNHLYREHKLKILMSLGVLVTLCIVAIPMANHKSIYDSDTVIELARKDKTFYHVYELRKDSVKNEPAEFTVASYEMDMKPKGNAISYRLDMEIQIPEDDGLDALTFTLYHGFDVLEITKNGQDIEWKQDKDTLSVDWNPEEYEGTITVKVIGNAGYKNRIVDNKFFLSTNFPWYPIPGKLDLVNYITFWGMQFKNTRLPDKTTFTVQVDTSSKVFSNLERIEGNTFKGDDYGMTLTSGHLSEYEESGISIVAPPDMAADGFEVYHKVIETIRVFNERAKTNKEVTIDKIFVVPLDTDYASKQIPVEYVEGQLFVSASQVNISGSNMSYDDFVIRSFYWYDRYRDKDYRIPLILSGIYTELYDVSTDNRFDLLIKQWDSKYNTTREGWETPIPSDEEKQLYRIANKVVQLMESGHEEELEELFQHFMGSIDSETLEIDDMEKALNAIE